MSKENANLVRAGYEALMRGDLAALARMISPDITWRGWDDGSGDCHNRDEALEVMQSRISERAIGELEEVTEIDGDRILVVTSLGRDSEISPQELGLPEGARR